MNNQNSPANNQHRSQSDSEFSLVQYKRVLYKYRWLIVFIFLATLGLTAYRVSVMHPWFQASSSVIMDEGLSQENFEVLQDRRSGSARQTAQLMNTRLEYVKSRSFTLEVVRELEKTGSADALYLLEQRKIRKDDPLSVATKSAKQFFSNTISAITGSGGESKGETEPGRLSLTPQQMRMDSLNRFAGRLQSWMTVEPREQASIAEVQITAPDAQEAALIANTVVRVFKKELTEANRTELTQKKHFIKSQLDSVSRRLKLATQRLNEFQRQSDAVALDQSTRHLVDRVTNLRSEHENVRMERRSTENRIKQIRNQLSVSDKTAFESMVNSNNPYIQSLQDTLARVQVQLTMLRTNPNVSQDHPSFKRVEERVEKLKVELRRAMSENISSGLTQGNALDNSQELLAELMRLQGQATQLRMREQMLDNLITNYNERIEDLPSKSNQLAELRREQEMNESLYQMLRNRYEEARIAEASQSANIRVMDYATVPGSPVKPKTLQSLILGGIFGLIFGGGLAFLLAFINPNIKGEEDLDDLGLSAVGAGIPEIPAVKLPKEAKRALDKEVLPLHRRLVYYRDTDDPVTEAYKDLYVHLTMHRKPTDDNSVLISSTGPQEGKSLTAANLAITFARDGKNVLLVDADMRRPQHHRVFRLKENTGLADVLQNRTSSLKEALHSTMVENLTVMPSGTCKTDPVSLLKSDIMQVLRSKLDEHYDYVIYDAPPLLSMSDGIILSRMIPNLLVLATIDQTNRSALQYLIRKLSKVDREIDGVILNRIDPKEPSGGYYYYYHSYYAKKSSNGKVKTGWLEHQESDKSEN